MHTNNNLFTIVTEIFLLVEIDPHVYNWWISSHKHQNNPNEKNFSTIGERTNHI